MENTLGRYLGVLRMEPGSSCGRVEIDSSTKEIGKMTKRTEMGSYFIQVEDGRAIDTKEIGKTTKGTEMGSTFLQIAIDTKESSKVAKGTEMGSYFLKVATDYEGDWKDSKRHGNGKLFYTNGDRYEGNWKDDKVHGNGKLFYASGNRYEGEYKDGTMHGNGIPLKGGKKFKYTYQNGKPLTSIVFGITNETINRTEKVEPTVAHSNPTPKSTVSSVIDTKLVKEWSKEPIGEGGFAVVHSDKYVGGPVAVKVIKGVRPVKKIQINEVLTMMKLRHPFVLSCHGYFLNNKKKTLNIVMELMDQNVIDYCQDATLKEKLVVMEKMAHALLYLHTKMENKSVIIHNDVKPTNFLVSNNGRYLKISDFGLSKIKRHSTTYSKNSNRAGTFVYFSPEYAIEGNYSVHSDIYALGISFYELLFNNDPFFKIDNLQVVMFTEKLKGGSYYPKYFKKDDEEYDIPDVPKDIYDDLLMKMWVRSPKKRMALQKVIEYLQKRVKNC